MKSTSKFSSASECSSVTSCFLAIASRKLNRREKLVLGLIASSEEKRTATKTAQSLAEQLQCAESTIWATLRSLRSLGLVVCEQEQEALTLSRTAKIFIKSNGVQHA
ncbi:hypothetical protein FJZ18_01230 [Candidatus Pacearchaeota archaeon]|nr:hypothetical protein [Candidatus Pacearchaeota archaeon]